MKKLVSILLTAVLLAALLAGCGQETAAPTESQTPAATAATETPAATDEPGTEAAEEPAAETAAFDFEQAAQRYSADTVVLTVGGTEITWGDYYGSLEQMVYEIYSYYGISDLNLEIQEGLTIGDWIKSWTEDYFRQFVMLHEKAEELGLTLTEEDLAPIDEDIRTQADAYFEGDVDALFEAMHIPESLYRYQAEASLLYDKLFAHFFGEGGSELSDEDAVAYAEENGYLYAKHILWSFTDDSGNALSDEEKDAKRDLAQEVLDELLDMSPDELDAAFDDMMQHYTEDPGVASYPDGYYFQTGEMVAVFEEAAAALELGQLSELVESDYGVHLLYRPAMRGEHVVSYDSGYNPVTLRYMAASGLFETMGQEWLDETPLEYADGFADLNLTDLFTYTA